VTHSLGGIVLKSVGDVYIIVSEVAKYIIGPYSRRAYKKLVYIALTNSLSR